MEHDRHDDALQEMLETVSEMCVYLHQNRHLALGEDEASMRVALGEGFEHVGIECLRTMAYTMLYEDMDQRENERIYLIAADSIVIDVRKVSALSDYHCDQLALLLRHLERPFGLLVNFGVHHFEPEIAIVGNDDPK